MSKRWFFLILCFLPAHANPQTPPPKVQLYGYLQSQYEDTTAAGTTRLFIRRARVGVRGDLQDGFGFDLMIDAAANTGVLRNAWIEYRGLQGAAASNLRFGQFKLPYSLEAMEGG